MIIKAIPVDPFKVIAQAIRDWRMAHPRPEPREPLLIVDPDRYWYASLPVSQLSKLDWRGRYVGSSKRGKFIGAGIGAFLGWIMAGLLLMLVFPFEVAVVLGFFTVPMLSWLPGWVIGERRSNRPLWVMRRVEGHLIAVVPKALLQSYDSSDKPRVIRADTLGGVREQLAIKNLFRRSDKLSQRLQIGSMVMLLIVLVGLMVFAGIAMEPPDEPLPAGQVSTPLLEGQEE